MPPARFSVSAAWKFLRQSSLGAARCGSGGGAAYPIRTVLPSAGVRRLGWTLAAAVKTSRPARESAAASVTAAHAMASASATSAAATASATIRLDRTGQVSDRR